MLSLPHIKLYCALFIYPLLAVHINIVLNTTIKPSTEGMEAIYHDKVRNHPISSLLYNTKLTGMNKPKTMSQLYSSRSIPSNLLETNPAPKIQLLKAYLIWHLKTYIVPAY